MTRSKGQIVYTYVEDTNVNDETAVMEKHRPCSTLNPFCGPKGSADVLAETVDVGIAEPEPLDDAVARNVKETVAVAVPVWDLEGEIDAVGDDE